MRAVVGDDGVENQRQAGGKQHAERPGAGQQTERVAFGIPRRQQDRHEHAAQRKNRDAGRAGERSKERADQGGNDGRAAAELPDQRLKHTHQPLGRSALGEEIARQRKDGNAGEHVIGGEAVVFERHGLDRQVVAPKQDQRRTAQGGEHRRTQERRQPQSHQRRNHQSFRRHRRPYRHANRGSGQRERQRSSTVFFRGVPEQAQQDQAKTDGQDKLDDPGRDAIDEDLPQRPHLQHILQAGQEEEEGDRRRKAAAEDLRRRPGPPLKQRLHR